jgi:Leucine-rich repeat (LRR) protein
MSLSGGLNLAVDGQHEHDPPPDVLVDESNRLHGQGTLRVSGGGGDDGDGDCDDTAVEHDAVDDNTAHPVPLNSPPPQEPTGYRPNDARRGQSPQRCSDSSQALGTEVTGACPSPPPMPPLPPMIYTPSLRASSTNGEMNERMENSSGPPNGPPVESQFGAARDVLQAAAGDPPPSDCLSNPFENVRGTQVEQGEQIHFDKSEVLEAFQGFKLIGALKSEGGGGGLPTSASLLDLGTNSEHSGKNDIVQATQGDEALFAKTHKGGQDRQGLGTVVELEASVQNDANDVRLGLSTSPSKRAAQLGLAALGGPGQSGNGVEAIHPGPGAYQVLPLTSLQQRTPRGSPNQESSSSDTSSAAEYVVEARLVMDEHEDVTSSSSVEPAHRSNVVENAAVEVAPMVEAKPLLRMSPRSKLCAFGAAALAMLLTAGIAVGITLGVVEKESSSATPGNSTASSTRPNETIPSGGSASDFRSLLPESTLQQIGITGSPQAQAYDWVLAHPPTEGDFVARQLQRFALATLFYSTDGGNWSVNDGWLDPDVIECNWYHDEEMKSACYNGSQTVTGIGLYDNGIRGTLPSEIALLSSLELLLLDSNDELSGRIPESLATLPALVEIYLGWNSFTGRLPDLGRGVVYAHFWNNQLTGTVPKSYGNLSDIRSMYIQDNALSGTFTEEIWGAWREIEILELSENQLEGTISSSVGVLTSLTQLGMSMNHFSGPLPTQLGMLSDMLYMRMGDNFLTSSIPTEIGGMKSAMYLEFHNNLLNGTIPSQFGLITNLRGLILDSNDLSGSIPTEIASLRYLEVLSLPKNALVGFLPSDLAKLGALTSLYLESNLLSGPIPTAFGYIPIIAELSLANNQLNSTIPTELGRLTSLTQLNLNGNLLTGTVPTQLAALTSLNTLSLHENRLVGSVPVGLCGLIASNSLVVHVNCDEVSCDCGCECHTSG